MRHHILSAITFISIGVLRAGGVLAQQYGTGSDYDNIIKRPVQALSEFNSCQKSGIIGNIFVNSVEDTASNLIQHDPSVVLSIRASTDQLNQFMSRPLAQDYRASVNCLTNATTDTGTAMSNAGATVYNDIRQGATTVSNGIGETATTIGNLITGSPDNTDTSSSIYRPAATLNLGLNGAAPEQTSSPYNLGLNQTPTINPSANTVDPPANTVDPPANTVDPPANTVDPPANTVDPPLSSSAPDQ